MFKVPWEVRYKELVEYKKTYGDCRVPIGFDENVSLANWVSTQRQEWRQIKSGRTSRLTAERLRLLNAIGFTWEAPRGGVRRRKRGISIGTSVDMPNQSAKSQDDLQQPDRCISSTAYSGVSIDANTNSNRAMISNTKSSIRAGTISSTKRLNKKTFIAEEEFKPCDQSWMKMFQEYVLMKERGQDPESSSNSSLIKWISLQRSQYNIWKQNPDKSDLNYEQINRLNSIHFKWHRNLNLSSQFTDRAQNREDEGAKKSSVPMNLQDTSTLDVANALVALRTSKPEDNTRGDNIQPKKKEERPNLEPYNFETR